MGLAFQTGFCCGFFYGHFVYTELLQLIVQTFSLILYLSRVASKPVFGVSNQVRHKLGCTTTEDG